MILNGYTVLDAFATFLRLISALLIVALGAPAWWKWQTSLATDREKLLEDRSYFLFLLAVFLVFLNVVSWPLLYLLLQSYVPELKGTMCIYGVTQIGAGSLGLSRFLPGLLVALQAIKPGLVFLAGAWLVLYLINRRTDTAPLMSRVLLLVVALGVVAVVDAGLEGIYLLIPKVEEFGQADGCCTFVFDPETFSLSRSLQDWLGEDHASWLYGAYYGVNGAMIVALAAYMGRPAWRRTGARLLPIGIGAMVSIPVNLVFLIEIAAPALRHAPNHHCPYDLLPDVPESIVAFSFFVLGCFAVGWAWLAGWLGRSSETRPFLGDTIGTLLHLGLLGYGSALAMLSIEMYLALP